MIWYFDNRKWIKAKSLHDLEITSWYNGNHEKNVTWFQNFKLQRPIWWESKPWGQISHTFLVYVGPRCIRIHKKISLWNGNYNLVKWKPKVGEISWMPSTSTSLYCINCIFVTLIIFNKIIHSISLIIVHLF